MNLKDFRTLFIAATLGVALVVASPALTAVLPEVGSERFSELWLLNSEHMADDFPYNVGVDEVSNVFIGIGNHMGGSEYYRVCVKFGNGSEFLPDIDGGLPSVLSPLYELQRHQSLCAGFRDDDGYQAHLYRPGRGRPQVVPGYRRLGLAENARFRDA